MLVVKIKKTLTEKVKAELIKEEAYNYSYILETDDKYAYLPVKKKIGNYDFTERKLKKVSSKNYKSLLDIDNLPSSFDIIGSIAILEITPELVHEEKKIANAILKSHKQIKTVLKKSGIHEGEFRTQPLEFISGEDTRETVHRENGVSLKLDVELVYFSPRLSTERKRIYCLVKSAERVLVMFSGCGPYPIEISKNTCVGGIIAIEKNPVAHNYADENVSLNKIKNVTLYNADVRDIVPKLKSQFDRILMPLPKGAEDFLDLALSVSRKGTVIHFYDFEHENELDFAEKKVKLACEQANKKFKIIDVVKCGQYGPGKFRLCVDFSLL